MYDFELFIEFLKNPYEGYHDIYINHEKMVKERKDQ